MISNSHHHSNKSILHTKHHHCITKHRTYSNRNMLLTITVWSALMTVSFSACGHYQGIPVNTCTEITNAGVVQESFMYTCNRTTDEDIFFKWKFDTADCTGNTSGIAQGFISQCGRKASSFYIPSKCSCDEITDCEIVTTKVPIICNESGYVQESHIMNQCVGKSVLLSTIRMCGGNDLDDPVITYNFDDVNCTCVDEYHENDDIKCEIERTGSNQLCPRYFQFPIGECVIQADFESHKYTCQDDGNGGYTYYKISYWTMTCEDGTDYDTEDVTADCSADEDNCYCGENGNVASVDNCNTAKLTDIIACDGTTENETVIINQCVAANDDNGNTINTKYRIYGCDNGISSVETYGNSACNQTYQSPSNTTIQPSSSPTRVTGQCVTTMIHPESSRCSLSPTAAPTISPQVPIHSLNPLTCNGVAIFVNGYPYAYPAEECYADQVNYFNASYMFYCNGNEMWRRFWGANNLCSGTPTEDISMTTWLGNRGYGTTLGSDWIFACDLDPCDVVHIRTWQPGPGVVYGNDSLCQSYEIASYPQSIHIDERLIQENPQNSLHILDITICI